MGLTWVGPITSPPANLKEARKRVLCLYAEWLRAVPRAIEMYRLDTPVCDARRTVRGWFEENKQIDNLDHIHQLTVKSSMDLIEMYNRWMQRPHMLKLFGTPFKYSNQRELLLKSNPGMSPFLADFLSK